jgi:AcrR family transcriptional regulator
MVAPVREERQTRKERAEHTRRKILSVAVERFSRQPYDEVSIADLADSAGVAHGLLFHHFQTKRGLYLEAMREAMTRMQREHDIESIERDFPSPGDRIRALLVRHLTYMDQHRDLALSLTRGGIGADSEAWDIFDTDRRNVAKWLLEMIDLDYDNHALRLVTRAAAGAVDEATVQWIQADRVLSIDSVVDALVDILRAALLSAERLDSSLRVSDAIALLGPSS